jgi:PAS domain S-box-containing protein
MKKHSPSRLRAETEELRLRLEEAEQALDAIRTGQVDSLVVEGPGGPRIFSLEGATQSYRVLVESMNEGAATLREDGTILYCNGRFAQLLGLPLQRVMGSALREHVPERVRGAVDRLVERGRDSSVREELPLRDARGDEIPAYLSVSSIMDAGSRVLCLVATDLREQRRSEALVAAERAARESERALEAAAEELRAAARRKDEFLGMLSHELRNPLAPIRNSIYVLKRAPPASAQAIRAQEVIERQVEHITKLVDDLLDVTRISHGKIELHRTPTDLALLVRTAGDDRVGLMQHRGVELVVDVPREPVWTSADPARLAQVVGNLLQNAAKFTAQGGRVTLALAVAGGAAEISVRDTGIGMDPALLDHLFEPFVQADRSLARTEGGLGLGLALVKGIAELHGGSVRARSAGPGQGSEFVVRLPLTDGVAPVRIASATAVGGAAQRVLVVDDNVDGAESLAEMVKVLGHMTVVAHDGPSALEQARSVRPHVVLCDIGLPGMSGYEVARALRATGPEGMRLIAVTGYARPEDVQRAIEAGFDRHVAKPVDAAEIERVLGSIPPRR